MLTIDWTKITKDENEVILKIAERYERSFGRPPGYQRMNLVMDISAAHLACPMDLEGLLESDAATFGHDIGGISRHINRETGELGGFFVPRTARRDTTAVTPVDRGTGK